MMINMQCAYVEKWLALCSRLLKFFNSSTQLIKSRFVHKMVSYFHILPFEMAALDQSVANDGSWWRYPSLSPAWMEYYVNHEFSGTYVKIS